MPDSRKIVAADENTLISLADSAGYWARRKITESIEVRRIRGIREK